MEVGTGSRSDEEEGLRERTIVRCEIHHGVVRG